MEQPILLKLPDSIRENIKKDRIKPHFCKYPVTYAINELIPMPTGTLFRQHGQHHFYYMELIETEIISDTEITFNVVQPTFFMVFILEGNFFFKDAEGNDVSNALEKNYYATYNGKSTFRIRMVKGIYRLMVVSFDTRWLLSIIGHYPAFLPVREKLLQESPDPIVMPLCAIGQTITYSLEKIRTNSSTDPMSRSIDIFQQLTQILSTYHNLVLKGKVAARHPADYLATTLRTFIENHYFSQKVANLRTIAKEIDVEEWKIKRLAYNLWGKPIHKQIISLRMEEAVKLIQQTNLSIFVISKKVGYNQVHYFYRAFKKHFGFLPSSLRKQGKK